MQCVPVCGLYGLNCVLCVWCLIAGQVSAGLQSSVSNGRYLVFQTSEFSPDHPVGVVRRKLTHRRLAAAQAPVSASTA